MSSVGSRKVVLVTAGAAGIGLAIAERFLEDGARVCVCDISLESLAGARARLPDLYGIRADVSQPIQVEALFAEILEWPGGLDVLINNAGIGGPRGPMEAISSADWDRTIAVNLSGAFYCMRHAVPIMKRAGSGCIINVSTSSVRTGLPGRLPYIASKSGLMGLTHTAARELGPANIRCNAILPGLVRSERGRWLVDEMARERGLSIENADAEMRRFVSMRTWIDAEEIGHAAVFLASDRARHITGQFLGVDGNLEWET